MSVQLSNLQLYVASLTRFQSVNPEKALLSSVIILLTEDQGLQRIKKF